MTSELYASILDAPQDDAPRLVYADHLTERGDPRGEFITVQCAVARLTRERKRHTAEYRAAKKRSDSLFAFHQREWFDRVIGLARWEKKVTRGFITHASISAKALQVRWDRFGRMPLEEVVFHRRLTDLEYGPMGCPEIGRLAWLMREPRGQRLRVVGLNTNTGSTEYDPRVLATALAAVTDDEETLSWPEGEWPDPRLLPAMRTLRDPSAPVRASFIHERPAELDHLEVVALRVASEEAIAFLDRPNLPHLRDLTLGAFGQRPRFDPSVVAHLVRSSVLSTLTTLKVDATLDETLVRALDERAPDLEALDVTCGATNGGLRAFATSKLPERLRSLELGYSLDAVSALPLAKAPFRRLETLSLAGFSLDDETGKAFAENPAFASVVDLSLGHHPSNATVAAIAASPHWAGTIAPFFGRREDGDDRRRELISARWGYY